LSCYTENSLHSTQPLCRCLISFIIIIDTFFYIWKDFFFILLFGDTYCDFYLHLTRCSPHHIIFFCWHKISLFPSGFISPWVTSYQFFLYFRSFLKCCNFYCYQILFKYFHAFLLLLLLLCWFQMFFAELGINRKFFNEEDLSDF
jgi:hypothetical protein